MSLTTDVVTSVSLSKLLHLSDSKNQKKKGGDVHANGHYVFQILENGSN